MHKISPSIFAIVLLLSCSSSAVLGAQRPQLTSDNSVTLVSPGGSTPLVKGFGFHGDILNVYGFGISYRFQMDVFLGYVMPIFHIFVLTDKIVINP